MYEIIHLTYKKVNEMNVNFRKVRYITISRFFVQNFLNEYPEAELVGWNIPNRPNVQVYRYEVTE
jgi:hypothetical protein